MRTYTRHASRSCNFFHRDYFSIVVDSKERETKGIDRKSLIKPILVDVFPRNRARTSFSLSLSFSSSSDSEDNETHARSRRKLKDYREEGILMIDLRAT